MQDVVYFDESNEEVTEVNPLNLPQVPNISLDSITTPTTPQSQSPDPNLDITSELSRDIPSTISGKYVKSSEVIVKDSRSSEATRSISSSTGHDAK